MIDLWGKQLPCNQFLSDRKFFNHSERLYIMSTIETILNSLTLEQAQTWFNLTDKWVYIDDIILAPAGLKANGLRVNAIEDKFEQMLSQVNS